jgi:hypothetical protein
MGRFRTAMHGNVLYLVGQIAQFVVSLIRVLEDVLMNGLSIRKCSKNTEYGWIMMAFARTSGLKQGAQT